MFARQPQPRQELELLFKEVVMLFGCHGDYFTVEGGRETPHGWLIKLRSCQQHAEHTFEARLEKIIQLPVQLSLVKG